MGRADRRHRPSALSCAISLGPAVCLDGQKMKGDAQALPDADAQARFRAECCLRG
jgi:hypothetical protein